MGKKFDQLAFILGIKQNKYPQACGQLFILDEAGDLYACALGQGLLATNAISEDKVRHTLKPEDFVSITVIKDGKQVRIKGRISEELEGDGMEILAKFGFKSGFADFVIERNDHDLLPVYEVAAAAREEFKIG